MYHIIKPFIIVALFTISYLIIRYYYTRKKNLYIWFARDYILKLYNEKQRSISIPIDEFSEIVIPIDTEEGLYSSSRVPMYFYFKGVNVNTASIYYNYSSLTTHFEFFDKPYHKIIEAKMKVLYEEEHEAIRIEKHKQALRNKKQKDDFHKTYHNKSK